MTAPVCAAPPRQPGPTYPKPSVTGESTGFESYPELAARALGVKLDGSANGLDPFMDGADEDDDLAILEPLGWGSYGFE